MKKIILILVAILTIHYANAQNTPWSTTGSIGIGTLSPSNTLDVKGVIQISDASVPMSIFTELPGTFNPLMDLSVNFRETNINTTYLGACTRIDARNNAVGPLFQWLYRPAGAPANTGESLLMFLNSSGQLAINTTDTKGYQLAVNGSVISTSITVKQYPWSDYVFRKDYQLPLLSEVKAYVELNHHLPEIPSEKEIATNGLNLGDIDRLLTKKVEELTLYMIEKDKQVKEEKETNSKQQVQIDLQRQANTALVGQLITQQTQIDSQKQELEQADTQLKAQDDRIKKLEDALIRLTSTKSN